MPMPIAIAISIFTIAFCFYANEAKRRFDCNHLYIEKACTNIRAAYK